MAQPRSQRRSEVDWLRTDVECSGRRWRPKHAPNNNVERDNNCLQQDLDEADESVAQSQPGYCDNESIHSHNAEIDNINVSNFNDSEEQHECHNFDMSHMAEGCVVITQNDDDTQSLDTQSSADATDDEFYDDDSIVDAVIELASAEKFHRTADTEVDDDIHSLNAYVCFSDPRLQEDHSNNSKSKKETRADIIERQKMWANLKDYGLIMRATLETELQKGLVCKRCVEDFLQTNNPASTARASVNDFGLSVSTKTSAFACILQVTCRRGHTFSVEPPKRKIKKTKSQKQIIKMGRKKWDVLKILTGSGTMT